MMGILGEVERRGAGGRGDPVLAGSCVRNLMIARHPLGGIVK